MPSGRTKENKMRYMREATNCDPKHNFIKNRSAHIRKSLTNKGTQSEKISKFKAEIDLVMNYLEQKDKRKKLS